MKYVKYVSLGLLVCSSSSLTAIIGPEQVQIIMAMVNRVQSQNFDTQWRDMQRIYGMLKKESYNSSLISDTEKSVSQNLGFVFSGSSNMNVLKTYSDFVSVNIDTSKYRAHLAAVRADVQKNLYETFRAVEFGGLTFDDHVMLSNEVVPCTKFDFETLSTVSKVLEASNPKRLESVVLVGTDFGNIARVLKLIVPEITIVLVDTPEKLALSYLYIRGTMPLASMIAHDSQTIGRIRAGSINLVPVGLLEKLDITTDVIVSSGKTELVAKMLAQKNYFGAEYKFIS